MTHPVKELESLVRDAVVRAFGPEHAAADPAVHRSAFADFQADVALRLARALKRPPLEIAKEVAAAFDAGAIVEAVRVSPPGFVNFELRRDYLELALGALARDARAGAPLSSAPETVVIDYSAPNVAKEMHVGHLRPTVIGDAIARLLELAGHRVIRQNHIGDWGTPFGMLIEHLRDLGTTDPANVELGVLNDFYKAARLKFDGDPAFAERARQRVVSLQSGDAESLALWRGLVAASRRYFVEVYVKFGVGLSDSDVRGESFYNPFLGEVAAELEQKGIARVDQGALCVFLPGFKNREGEPLPLIVRKTDGGFGYAATDLAAIRYRALELRANRALYVVGAPQQQHFAMVFATARAAGWLDGGMQPEHIWFGSVLGTDRKMMRTRSGETPRLVDLLDEAEERADAVIRDKNPDLPPDVRAVVAKQVGAGAIKYADLSTERIKDYVFDLTRMVSFEGNTGPYLQYAHARASSILRRVRDEGVPLAGELLDGPLAADVALRLEEPSERALALELTGFASAIGGALAGLALHRLSPYLYELSGKFMAFYENCTVRHAPTPELRDSRLVLVAATRRALALGLSILGMAAPQEM